MARATSVESHTRTRHPPQEEQLRWEVTRGHATCLKGSFCLLQGVSRLAVRQAEAIKAREAEVEQLKKDQQAQAQKHEVEMKELRELIKQATAKGK